MNLNGLEIDIIRSNRKKTVSINIERNGGVNIIVPLDLNESKILFYKLTMINKNKLI